MKTKQLVMLLVLLCLHKIIYAQQNVGIGTATPAASALLDIKSGSKGVLVPRVNLISETDVVTVVNPATSLLIYNTNTTLLEGEGHYFWNGTKWSKFATRSNLANLAWGIAGNAGTNAATDFIGTIDNKPLIFKTNDIESGKIDPQLNNVFFGRGAGLSALGINNSFFGHNAGSATTTGKANVFFGEEAGKLNTTGANNTIVGEDAGVNNIVGDENTFLGNGAGRSLIGSNVIAIGKEAFGSTNNSPFLHSIAIGDYAGFNNENTPTAPFAPSIFIGHAAGYNGNGGIAIGDSAAFNFSDYRNIAIGLNALKNNRTGVLDIAIGSSALAGNTNGEYNIALGQFSMRNNTTGDFNVAIGNNALDENIVGDNNTAIGAYAGFFGFGVNNLNNTTILGYEAQVSTSNTMVFGNGNINRWAFGLNTTTGNNALQVGDNSTNGNGAFLTQGGTWTNTSSRIKKEDFSYVDGLEILKKIKQMPVQRWKYKGTNEYHIGPVAEDFYKLFGLGVDDKGISTVDPAGIALAAIQEQQRRIEKQHEQINQLQIAMEQFKKEIYFLKQTISSK